MKSERLRRMYIAGARPLNTERWQKIVSEAVDSTPDWRPPTIAAATPSPAPVGNKRYVTLVDGDIVVSAQMILDLEMTLCSAQDDLAEVRRLLADREATMEGPLS